MSNSAIIAVPRGPRSIQLSAGPLLKQLNTIGSPAIRRFHGAFARIGDRPVLAGKHQSATAMERNARRLQLAVQRPSSVKASGLIVDGRSAVT
jgi:hypothetical protein